jgi:multiple sugar transport system substrate-binding protein
MRGGLRIFAAVLLAASVFLASCGGEPDPGGENNGGSGDGDGNGTGTPTITATPAPSATPAAPTPDATATPGPTPTVAAPNGGAVIRYAHWNMHADYGFSEDSINHQMIAEYMDNNPDVVIDVVENVDFSDLASSLRELGAAGNMPDLVAVLEMPLLLTSGYLMDISVFTRADGDWAQLPPSVLDAVRFGEGVYAIPSALYAYGFWVNDGMFREAGVAPLRPGFSYEELVNAAVALTNRSKTKLGLGNIEVFPDWLPHYLDDSLGCTSWDGRRFNLDSPAFIEAIRRCAALVNGKYTATAFDEGDWAAFNALWSYGEIWEQGNLAISHDITWSAAFYENASEWIDTRFIGMPGGKNLIVSDFIAITAGSRDPQAVFDFAKWMTFGAEGSMRRVELRDTLGLEMDILPVNTSAAVWDAYFAGRVEGYRESLGGLRDAILEGEAYIPGYAEAFYGAQTGVSLEIWGSVVDETSVKDVINAGMFGVIDYAVYAERANRTANGAVAAVQADMESFLVR